MESYISLDKNMIVNTTIGDAEVTWYDVREGAFSLHGLYEPKTEPFFRRVAPNVAKATSVGVDKLGRESAGGRVRFATNSPYIAIRAKFLVVGRSSHLSLISTSGFDLYVDGEFGSRFVKEFRMPYDMTDYYEQIIPLDREVMRTYTINFPIHAVVEKLEIGLKPDAILKEATPYRAIDPIVIYGSSIVHGTAASRPGTTYPAILSRMLNMDYRNLGFSGKALGEQALVRWMATLPMSVFVCDYDHNAPTTEHLATTHYALYETVREKNPNLPYIMITRPNYYTNLRSGEMVLQNRDVIMSSYLKARATGDQNVYFIDGMSFFNEPHQYDTIVDGVHPNDVGFVRMADAIGTVIRFILEKSYESKDS